MSAGIEVPPDPPEAVQAEASAAPPPESPPAPETSPAAPAPDPTPPRAPYRIGMYRRAKPPAPPAPPPPPVPVEEVVPTSPYRAAAGKTQHGRWSDGDRYADLLSLAVIAPATQWEPYYAAAADQVVERARGLAEQLPEVALLRQHRERTRAAAQAVEGARIERDQTALERRKVLNRVPAVEDLEKLDELDRRLVDQERHLMTLEKSAGEYRRGEAELLQAAQRAVARLAAEQATEMRARVDRQAEAALARAAAAAGDHLVEWLRHHRTLIDFRNVEGLAAQGLLEAALADGVQPRQ
jgi:hypothetical protein